ncbi:MAG: heparan-alpha-glucosaminide N-acetyltransferase domain-containing protein [Bacteroidota bacterium]|nr:heparan-alpha-glucosaminide N-acetyltransferase domain-containing protein [Bacteroidota bacterium]
MNQPASLPASRAGLATLVFAANEVAALPPAAERPRVQAVDVVRGLVMVIMALDHIREFWTPMTMRAEDVAQASAALFFTRWVTHFCAPTFVFLSGVSIWLYGRKQPSRARTSGFLFSRGLWLVAVEVVLISFVLQWQANMILLEVIWAIGAGMVLLAALIWLPRGVLAVLAVVIVAGHNALPVIQPVTASNAGWALLHNPPFLLPLGPLPPALVAYSVGPWLGVMLAGYVLGPWFALPLPQRNRRLRLAGLAALALFVVLRATNWYGDPAPWSVQPRGPGYTLLSFLNVTKYPPSLLFLCLTLGGALLLLSVAEQATSRPARWLRTFGRVPFFYFVVHLLLISGAAWVWTRLAFGQAVNFSFASVKEWPATYHPSLLRAYVVWALVVLALYWPCRWYQRYKQRHASWWLSYL